MDNEKLHTVTELAVLLKMHPATVQRHLKNGVIKGTRINRNGRWRIPQAEVNRLMGVTK